MILGRLGEIYNRLLLGEIAGHLRPGSLVISIAAGITTEFIERLLPMGTHVVRVMPNTPALVDQAMSAIAPGTTCTPEHLAVAESLLHSVGKTIQLPEKYMDAVTAISGSGPAYIYYVTEAMIDDATLAAELVAQIKSGALPLPSLDKGGYTNTLYMIDLPAGVTGADEIALEHEHKGFHQPPGT